MNSAAFLKYQDYFINQKNEVRVFNSEVIQWAYALALPVAGFLVLYTFLSLGGVFALLGPWAVFIAAKLITCYWNKKVCEIETIEIQRDNLLKFRLTLSYSSKRFR